jgi:hypothetical protein
MALSTRALVVATIIGTVLQLAMIVGGHYSALVASFFAVGGMGFSLIVGVIYGWNAHPTTPTSAAAGGLLAGAICALIGILASYLWGDVPASLLVLGTLSSAVTGAVGGWIGHFFGR